MDRMLCNAQPALLGFGLLLVLLPPPFPSLLSKSGLFQGPHTTGEAIKGGRLVAEVMSRLGFRVVPGPDPHLPTPPSMITAVELGSREAMVAFCKGIQLACPVGSYITPEPGVCLSGGFFWGCVETGESGGHPAAYRLPTACVDSS